MSVWKKAMFYLGLGPEDSYDNSPPPAGLMPEEGMAPPGDASGSHVTPVNTGAAPQAGVGPTGLASAPGAMNPGAASPMAQAGPGVRMEAAPAETSAVRALGPMDVKVEQGSGLTSVSPPASAAASAGTAGASGQVGAVGGAGGVGAANRGINTVRPLPASSSSSSKPHVVSPRSFNDAQEVADRFRAGAPVIMNLQEVDRDLSRRLIDFASGMCYGLAGQMEKIGDRVYLLSPADVELSPEHRRELHEQGLHNG